MNNTSTLDHALMFGVPLSLAILIAVGLYGVVHRDRAIHFKKDPGHKPYRWSRDTTHPATEETADPGDRSLGVQAVPDEIAKPDGPHET